MREKELLDVVFEKYGLEWKRDMNNEQPLEKLIEKVRREIEEVYPYREREHIMEMIFRDWGYLVVIEPRKFKQQLKAASYKKEMPGWMAESLEIRYSLIRFSLMVNTTVDLQTLKQKIREGLEKEDSFFGKRLLEFKLKTLFEKTSAEKQVIRFVVEKFKDEIKDEYLQRTILRLEEEIYQALRFKQEN